MAEEIASQTNTEDVVSESAPEIGKPIEEVEGDKGPEAIYKDAEPEAEKSESEKEPEEEKAKEPEKKPEAEDIKISKPEESLLSDADMESIESYAKDQGLSKEATQKLVESQSGVLGKYADQQLEAHEKQVSTWSEECKADKEIGGDHYAESVELAKRVVHRFGSDEFLESLNATGFGNNPEVVRCFSRIGKAMSDDKLVTGGAHPGGNRSMEDVFYSNNKEN